MHRSSAAPRSLRVASLAGIAAAFFFARSAAAQTALFDWSGATPQAQLGKAACAPGDLNGDGIGDVVLAERLAPSAWAYRARSGLDGATLWTSTYVDLDGQISYQLWDLISRIPWDWLQAPPRDWLTIFVSISNALDAPSATADKVLFPKPPRTFYFGATVKY